MARPAARARRRDRRAFTLVELMVCIVVLATLTALAAANLRAGRRASGLRSALVQLETEDQLMRDRSRLGGGEGRLVFDLDAGRVTRVEADAQGRERTVPLTAFPEAARVERVRTVGGRIDRSEVTVTCSRAGRTPSYAVLVSAGGNGQWVLVIGMTGKTEMVDDEAQVEDIFRQIEPRRDRDDAR